MHECGQSAGLGQQGYCFGEDGALPVGKVAVEGSQVALAELREAREAPSRNGRRLNLLYGTQVRTRPPRFRFFVNDPGLITRDYGYWVENQLRDRFDLRGVPVAIDFVRRS